MGDKPGSDSSQEDKEGKEEEEEEEGKLKNRVMEGVGQVLQVNFVVEVIITFG